MPGRKLATDHMIIQDSLQSHRDLAQSYTDAMLDSLDAGLREDLGRIYREEVDNADRLFREMANRGWYQPAMASQEDIARVQEPWKAVRRP